MNKMKLQIPQNDLLKPFKMNSTVETYMQIPSSLYTFLEQELMPWEKKPLIGQHEFNCFMSINTFQSHDYGLSQYQLIIKQNEFRFLQQDVISSENIVMTRGMIISRRPTDINGNLEIGLICFEVMIRYDWIDVSEEGDQIEISTYAVSFSCCSIKYQQGMV